MGAGLKRILPVLAVCAAILGLLLSGCPNPLLDIVKREVANFAGSPEIQVSKGGLVIPSGGAADVGTSLTGQSKLVTFTIQNLGGASLNLSGSPEISGADAASFSIDTPPFTSIEGGRNSIFILDFHPTTAAAKTALLTIHNSDADEGTYTFALNGTGVAGVGPEINLMQGSNNVDLTYSFGFGGVLVDTITDIVFTIQNIGTPGSFLGLSMDPVAVTGGGGAFIVLTQPASLSIPEGGSSTFSLRFQPSSVGSFNASVTIANNDSDENPYTFTVSGGGLQPDILVKQGVTNLADGTGLYTFPDVRADGNNEEASAPVTFTLENIGTYPLTLTGISLSAGNTSDFDLTNITTSPVNPGGSTTFTVRFDPLARAGRAATVSIVSDAPGAKNPYTFDVTGTGTFAPKVYWANRGSNSIWRANLNGSNAELVISTGAPIGLAIDQANDYMYWTEYGGQIKKTPLDGGTVTTLLSVATPPYGITLDVPGNAMFWAEYGGYLGKAALDGSGPTLVPTPVGNYAFGIAVDGTTLYWSGVKPNNMIIYKGTTAPTFGSQLAYSYSFSPPAGIALNTASGHLYWAEKGSGLIVRWLLGTGVDLTFSAGSDYPNFLALDTGNNKIYWTEQNSGGIWRADLDGQNSQMIVGGQGLPYGISLDLVP